MRRSLAALFKAPQRNTWIFRGSGGWMRGPLLPPGSGSDVVSLDGYLRGCLYAKDDALFYSGGACLKVLET